MPAKRLLGSLADRRKLITGGRGAMNLPLKINIIYMNISNEIFNIDRKLTELRKRWVLGSPAMKVWIESGAKLLKEEKEHLQKRAENEKVDEKRSSML